VEVGLGESRTLVRERLLAADEKDILPGHTVDDELADGIPEDEQFIAANKYNQAGKHVHTNLSS